MAQVGAAKNIAKCQQHSTDPHWEKTLSNLFTKIGLRTSGEFNDTKKEVTTGSTVRQQSETARHDLRKVTDGVVESVVTVQGLYFGDH
jgi:hypothetical protein